VKVCVLLDKPSRRRVDVPVDYRGFVIEDRFVVGYGMDFNERYRNLPYIGYLVEPPDAAVGGKHGASGR
jgi:hypoxanthine phosphoribosyltransferase